MVIAHGHARMHDVGPRSSRNTTLVHSTMRDRDAMYLFILYSRNVRTVRSSRTSGIECHRGAIIRLFSNAGGEMREVNCRCSTSSYPLPYSCTQQIYGFTKPRVPHHANTRYCKKPTLPRDAADARTFGYASHFRDRVLSSCPDRGSHHLHHWRPCPFQHCPHRRSSAWR